MRRIEAEVLVQSAVLRRQADLPTEDDRIEFKRDWPEPSRARQFAGAANALRGEPLIYVIGVNDDGSYNSPEDVEPADWWRSFVRPFDSPPPNLLHHMTVQVGDSPQESVVALVFDTDEFPYVVKVEGPSDRREVPIRVASGTASANRTQLLRMLAPTVAIPGTELSHAGASVVLTRFTPRGKPETLSLSIAVNTDILVAHTGPGASSISTDTVQLQLHFDGVAIPLGGVWFDEMRTTTDSQGNPPPEPPRFGVYVRDGFVVATAAGKFVARSRYTDNQPMESAEGHALFARATQLAAASDVRFSANFRFVGSERAVTLSGALRPKVPQPVPEDPERNPFYRELTLISEQGD